MDEQQYKQGQQSYEEQSQYQSQYPQFHGDTQSSEQPQGQGQNNQTFVSVVPTPVIIETPQVEKVTYYVSETDRTLRLIAFIFMVLSLIGTCWLILPLAWMIPMTVISWGIYKGTKPNSTAFAVCTLIFASLVAGILLLISTKNK